MNQKYKQLDILCKLAQITSLCLLKFGVVVASASAQITPDQTLGDERSRVTSDVPIRGRSADRIDGGASRGSNLFHSFQEFNVRDGQRVYFHNPAEITNIFSRVTGSTVSQILGTLGVDGAANLFLLNPNGILFGSKAQLDISGSFVATTANAIQFGDDGFFSATSPEQSSLLEINPSALFFNQVASQGGVITNAGNLQVGQDLTLAGQNLELQGQVWAGDHLTLQAQDTVRMQDSVTAPMIAAAKGALVVQGQTIDIFALNHPQSGLFSGADMILRSANPVRGDAHYWSGGNFRIEQLNGEPGDLVSPFDPVIRSLGNVSFDNYEGASLHIIAAGSVNLGTAIITAPETASDQAGYLQETVALSDGMPLAIDGSRQATLDIRAGVSPDQIITPGLTGLNPEMDFFFDDGFLPDSPTLTSQPTSTEIVIGDVFMIQPGGLVYLSNQYQPQTNLPPGSITITGRGLFQRGGLTGNGIDARGFAGDGSAVMIDARGDILLSTSFIDTSSDTGNAGRVALLAGRDIVLGASTSARSSIEASAEAGRGGNLTLRAGRDMVFDSSIVDVSSAQGGSLNLEAENIYLFESTLSARITGAGTGSPETIALNARGNIRLEDSNILTRLDEQATGNAGGITINTRDLTLTRSSVLDVSTSGQGDAGDIAILASGRVSFDRGEIFGVEDPSAARSNVNSGAVGNGGDIFIRADSLYLASGGRLEAIIAAPTVFSEDNITPAGQGNAGNIDVDVENEIVISGQIDRVSSKVPSIFGSNAGVFPNSRSSGIFNLVDREATGNGGNITVEAGSLSLLDGGQIAASNYSQGSAGQINLEIREGMSLSGTDILRQVGENAEAVYLVTSAILNQIGQDAQGNSGGITIRAGTLAMTDVSEISASTFGRGNAGNLSLQIDGALSLANLSNIRSVVEPGAIGNGGNIQIQAESLSLTNGAQIVAGVFRATDTLSGGQGNGGQITINVSDAINLSGVGTIDLAFPAVNPLNVSPDPPFAPVTLSDRLQTAGISSGILTITEVGATGQARDIVINTDTLRLANGAVITAQTENSGDGGNIIISANIFEALAGGQVITNTSNAGRAGNITLDVRDQITLAGTDPTYNQRLSRFGRATIANTSENSGLFANIEVDATGDGGEIELRTARLNLTDSAQILASTSGRGDAGNVTVRDAERVNLDRSTISTTVNAGAVGSGGDINLRTGLLNLNRSSITSSTSGTGNTGSIIIQASDETNLRNRSRITSEVRAGAVGNSQRITLDTPNLFLGGNSAISAATDGNGTAGEIRIRGADQISLSNSTISTQVRDEAVVPRNLARSSTRTPANRGNITIDTQILTLDNSQITASTNGSGSAGNVNVNDADTILLRNDSSISTAVQRAGRGRSRGRGGDITLNTNHLTLDNSEVTASTNGRGRAGNITLNANRLEATNAGRLVSSTNRNYPAGTTTLRELDSVILTGSNSGIFANTNRSGRGGRINLQTRQLSLSDGAALSSTSQGSGAAGNIQITALDQLQSDAGNITTRAIRAPGGNITLTGGTVDLRQNSNIRTDVDRGDGSGGDIVVNVDEMRLQEDSDIQTRVGENGSGDGGDIAITANSIIAFDDSDIITEAPNQGGNITLNTPAFFGSNYRQDTAATGSSDGNGRVDLDASGEVSAGTIQTPDTSFIQNSLSDLPASAIDTEVLLANSCIARTEDGGTFLITGSGGLLPTRPGTAPPSAYPTGPVRSVSDQPAWNPGDPIVEPQGVYRLANGRLVLSRECRKS